MKNKFILLIIFSVILMTCSGNISFAREEDEKVRPDAEIYKEFKHICEHCSDNVSYEGISTYRINGAPVTAKLSVTSENLEKRKMKFELYGDVYTVTISAGKVSICCQNNGKTDERVDKINMLKYSLNTLLDELYDNGRIVKKIRNGKIIYTIKLYNFDQIHEYCLDSETGYFEYSSARSISNVDPAAERFEGTYEAKYRSWNKNK